MASRVCRSSLHIRSNPVKAPRSSCMRSTPRRLIVTAFLAVAVLVFGAPAAFAQGGVTSTLSGTVTDTSGAVIPGASVIVKRADTAVTSEAVTNAEGQFTIPQLNPGKYSVVVTLSG